MSWLKFDTCTPEKPEVFAITIAMGWEDPDLTVGKLLKVWRWFDSHSSDGNAKNVTLPLLDRVIGVTGFAQAMVDVGWLVITETGLGLPKFDVHNGSTAKGRAETAVRVAKHRVKKDDSTFSHEKEADVGRYIIPRPVRAAVFKRDSFCCVYCGRKEGEYAPPEMARDAVLSIDHVIPLSRGGSDEISNYATACSVCNMFKSDRTPEECGLTWPIDESGNKLGNTKTVTNALPREEKRREEKKEPKGSKNTGAAKPLDVPDQVWIDWITVRKAKKAGLPTLTSITQIEKEAEKVGISLGDAIAVCCKRGWVGFEADWFTRSNPRASPQAQSRHSGFETKDYREGITEDGALA